MLQAFNDVFHLIVSGRAVHCPDVVHVHGIQFQNIVVHFVECGKHFRVVDKGGIAQYADLSIGEIFVAQGQCIFNNLWK